jgi:hypothetical protein
MKRCWLLHLWGKWQRFEVQSRPRKRAANDDGWSIEGWQYRICERCGYREEERLPAT